jgi:hypothetical protein
MTEDFSLPIIGNGDVVSNKSKSEIRQKRVLKPFPQADRMTTKQMQM